MEKGEPLFFWIKKLVLPFMIAGFVAGCAIDARNLLPDHCSIDAKEALDADDFEAKALEKTCSEIDDAIKILERESSTQIKAQNTTGKRVIQVLGGLIFLPALLATDNSAESKIKIENINRTKDKLYKLRAFKKCPQITEEYWLEMHHSDSMDVYGRLKKLERLFKDGLITQEEYDKKKTELLKEL